MRAGEQERERDRERESERERERKRERESRRERESERERVRERGSSTAEQIKRVQLVVLMGRLFLVWLLGLFVLNLEFPKFCVNRVFLLG